MMKALIVFMFLFMSAEAYGASANLSWQDNSGANNDSEEGFSIERNLNGGAFSAINTVKSNITTYVDSTIVAPPAVTAPTPPATNTYCYQVKAFNHGTPVPPATTGPMQVASPSNQACVDVLGIQNPAPIGVPAPASNLTAVSSPTAAAARKTAAPTPKPKPKKTGMLEWREK